MAFLIAARSAFWLKGGEAQPGSILGCQQCAFKALFFKKIFYPVLMDWPSDGVSLL